MRASSTSCHETLRHAQVLRFAFVTNSCGCQMAAASSFVHCSSGLLHLVQMNSFVAYLTAAFEDF